MYMKKVNVLISILIMCISLTACTSKKPNNPNVPNPPIEKGGPINPPQAVKTKVFEKDKEELFSYQGGEYAVSFYGAHKYIDSNNTSSMNNWVCIEYKYKNVDINQDIEITPSNFVVKDQGNTVLEFTSNYEGGESPMAISKGKDKTVKMIYKAEKPVTKVNVTFRGVENNEDLGSIELSINED